MPGTATFTCLRDNSNGNSQGVSVSGNAVTVTDGNETIEFNENFTGRSATDASAVFGKQIADAVLSGQNVNFVAMNGQNFLYQDGGTRTGLVHHIVGDIFKGASSMTNATIRIQLTMIDIQRNKLSDLFEATADRPININSKNTERVPSFEGARTLAVDSAETVNSLVDAALYGRARSLAQGGLNQIAHTVLQVHIAKIVGKTQHIGVLTFVNVEMSTDESSLQFAAMARDFSAGTKQLKASADNNLVKALRTSLGGNAHTYAYAALHSNQGVGPSELTVKTLGALSRIKDVSTAKEFAVDAELADQNAWGQSVAATAEVAAALRPPPIATVEEKRASVPHLVGMHSDRLADGRILMLLEPGSKRAGRGDAKIKQDHILTGLGIQSEHCTFANVSGKCSVTPANGAGVKVNGQDVKSGKSKTLSHNDRLRLGAFLTFRVVVPGKTGPADRTITMQVAEREIAEAAKAAVGTNLAGDADQQDAIGKLLPMINEANHISEELKRNINFMLKMVAKQSNGSTGSEVQVQVTYGDNEEVLWDTESFLDRVYEMRDIYDQFVSRGRDLQYINTTYTGTSDPFAKQSGETVVGRAMIYLDAVNHLLAVHETTPIIDYKGFSRGELKVELDLQLPNVAEKDAASKFDELERVENLKGKQLRINLKVVGIRGLPSNMCQDSFVSFRFFLDESPLTTPKEAKKTINPKFDFQHCWNLVVTDELCKYLASDVLEFIVYAKSSSTGSGSTDVADKTQGPTAGNAESIDEDTLQQLQEKEEELQELKFQLSEQKIEMERKMREKDNAGGNAATSASKLDGKNESVDDLKEHIEFLEQKIEQLESAKKQLQVTLAERDDDLQEAQNQLDDDEETMQQQLTKIQELEQQLAEAKKSKACTIL